jgi:hypothetical protein
MAQTPVPSSDTSTVVASPVRSRWNSAPIESPKPEAGGVGTCPYSGRAMAVAAPARAQNASES